MSLKKTLRAAAAPAAAALLLAVVPSASAFSHDVGTTGVGKFSTIAFDRLTACDNMAFTGHVTSNDRTYGTLGGTFQIDQASFTNCTPGTKVRPNLPFSFSVDPAGGYGVGLDVSSSTTSGTCRYSGGLWGAGGVGSANVGGDMYRRTTSCGGPSQFEVRLGLAYTDAAGGTL